MIDGKSKTCRLISLFSWYYGKKCAKQMITDNQWLKILSLWNIGLFSIGFSLLLRFSSSGNMKSGEGLLFWYGLVFGPNWEFIEFLQTQSDGLAEVLDFNGEYSCWIGCYWPIITSRYLTWSKSMLPQIWSWWHYLWIFIVNHVGYFKVYHTINKMKSLILLYLHLL